MTTLSDILASLHENIERRLQTARRSFDHPTTKGDASEHVWLDLLNTYLPQRYSAENAHVVDSEGNFSDQIDVVIFEPLRECRRLLDVSYAAMGNSESCA